MGYKLKTNFFRIPYMGQGDIMTQEQNSVQMSIIDNLLYAATFGCSKCLLQQGRYEGTYDQYRSQAQIKIIPYEKFSLMGVLNYRLFYFEGVLDLGLFLLGKRYYIYLYYDEQLQNNPQKVSIRAFEQKKQITEYNMLLCVATVTYESIEIETDVSKVYGKNILAHTQDTTNPHGEQLIQKKLVVTDEIIYKDKRLIPPEYDSFITSNQGYVYNISNNKKVKFVIAYPESLQAGNISWKIENNKIIFNNSGNENIKVNFKIEYGD